MASLMPLFLFLGNGFASEWDGEHRGFDIPDFGRRSSFAGFADEGNSYEFPNSVSLESTKPGRLNSTQPIVKKTEPSISQVEHVFANPDFLLEETADPQVYSIPEERVYVTDSGWQILPDGLLYHSYLAGTKEPRFASQWLSDQNRGMVWEAVVGGRWGLFRHGGEGPDAEGFQFDVIGAAFVRIDPEEESDLEAADFNAGFVGTWHYGRWRYKLGYNHYSCHLGDEYVLKNLGLTRYNYVRDSILFGTMYDITPELQIYGEMYVALGTGGGAEPFEFQTGVQYSPAQATGIRGAPFFAVNGHFRQEHGGNGSVNAQAGWAWRGGKSNRLFRFGFQHYNGPSMQWSFVDRYENMTGMGLWFDY